MVIYFVAYHPECRETFSLFPVGEESIDVIVRNIYTIYNEYKQRQTKYSFFYFSNEANNKINRPMLEKSRTSNSRVLIGVLSNFQSLKQQLFE